MIWQNAMTKDCKHRKLVNVFMTSMFNIYNHFDIRESTYLYVYIITSSVPYLQDKLCQQHTCNYVNMRRIYVKMQLI